MKYPDGTESEWKEDIREREGWSRKDWENIQGIRSRRITLAAYYLISFRTLNALTVNTNSKWLGILLFRHLDRPFAEALDKSLQYLIIGLADQQLILGLAMLTAAVLEWDNYTISAYHFNLVAYLAWFSCFTHAITLLTLMDWMRESRSLLCVRLSLFSAVLGVFLWTQIMARDYTSLPHASSPGFRAACPARCCISDSLSFNSYNWVRLCPLLLVALRVIWMLVRGLFRRVTWFDGLSTKLEIDKDLSFALRATNFYVAVILFAIVTGLGYSLTIIGEVRDISNYPNLEVSSTFFQEQNSWGFGQIVSMILLVLPFLAAVEGFIGKLPSFSSLFTKGLQLTGLKTNGRSSLSRWSKRRDSLRCHFTRDTCGEKGA